MIHEQPQQTLRPASEVRVASERAGLPRREMVACRVGGPAPVQQAVADEVGDGRDAKHRRHRDRRPPRPGPPEANDADRGKRRGDKHIAHAQPGECHDGEGQGDLAGAPERPGQSGDPDDERQCGGQLRVELGAVGGEWRREAER